MSTEAAREAASARVAGLSIWSGPVEPEPLARRHHQPQLRRRRRRAPLRRAHRRRHPRSTASCAPTSSPRAAPPMPPASRPRVVPRRARARWSSTSSTAAPSPPTTCAIPRNLDAPRRRSCAAATARSPAPARAGADLLGVPRRARLRPHARATARAGTCRSCRALLARAARWRAPSGRSTSSSATTTCCAANLIDDGDRLWLVDWDYAGFNSPLFDLGGLASNSELSPAQAARRCSSLFRTRPSTTRCAAAPRR